MNQNRLEILAELINRTHANISFTILEIGALPLEDEVEPFHQLVDCFPGSQIIAFEIDHKLCADLNAKSKPGHKYYPVALGRTEETCSFYETNHPMCCSLYKPNGDLIDKYNNMEVAMLKSIGSIDTTSLDQFSKENNIKDVDFIKIDIQGAELDVFKGGRETLKAVVAIVSEVEFIPIYVEQPLFGDVCSFLSENEFMFHKFLGLAGRSLKPVILADDPNFAVQHMWADAVFIKDILTIPQLTPQKLLKLGLLSFIYGSPDVAFHCFRLYDEWKQTNLSQQFLEMC